MSRLFRRLRRGVAVAVTAAVTSAFAVSAAHAAPASLPSEVNIRLSDADKATMTDKSYWWTNEAASHSMVKFVEAGADLVLHYRVTDTADAPVVGTTLTLNTSGNGTFTGALSATTDGNGEATFTLTNTVSNSDAEPRPVAPSSMSYFADGRGGFNEIKYDINPTIGATTEHVDRVWTHTVKTESAPAATEANLRLSEADKASMTDKSYWWTNEAASHSMVKFVEAGSTLVLHYKATDKDGNALAGKTMTLNTGAINHASFTGSLVATTDSNGEATFTLTSTTSNDNAEIRPVEPSSMSYWDDSRGATLNGFESTYNFEPTIGADIEHVDRVWTHTVKAEFVPATPPAVAYIYLTDASKASMANKSYWWTNEAESHSMVKFVTAGDDLTVTYVVTDGEGNVQPNLLVTFKCLGGSASFSGCTDGTIQKYTNASGEVTFTVTSTTSAANAEPRPVAPSSMDYWDDSRTVPSESNFNFEPTVGATVEHIDRIWTHTVKPASSDVVALANIYLSDADKASMTDKSYWWTNEAASHSMVKFVTAGADLVLHYRVTDGSGNGIAGKTVTLNSNPGGACFTGDFSGTTDGDGYVTFTLHNCTSAADAEPAPVAPSSMSYWDDTRTVSPEKKYDFWPTIGASVEHIDRVWTHTVKPEELTIRLSDADKASMTDKSYWWTNEAASHSMVKFVTAGDTLTLHYRVTDANGPVAGRAVTLSTNPGGGCFTGSLTGTTDNLGYVTFTLANCTTNASAEPRPVAPSSMSYWDDSRVVSPEVKYDFWPSAGAAVEHIDRVWTHTVKQPAPTAPAAISGINVSTGDGMLHAEWTAPFDGYSAITGYSVIVRLHTGASRVSVLRKFTLAGDATSFDLDPVSNGLSLSVSVAAMNAIGSSAATTSARVAVGTAAAPTVDNITAGDGKLTIEFTAGDPGAADIKYFGYSLDGGATWTANRKFTGSPLVVKKLNNGETYSVLVRAYNKYGAGAASAATAATPVADAPYAPKVIRIVTTANDATITFKAGYNGGADITDYEYSIDGGATWTSAGVTEGPITIEGLDARTTYSLSLRAVNAVGAGAESSARNFTTKRG